MFYQLTMDLSWVWQMKKGLEFYSATAVVSLNSILQKMPCRNFDSNVKIVSEIIRDTSNQSPFTFDSAISYL